LNNPLKYTDPSGFTCDYRYYDGHYYTYTAAEGYGDEVDFSEVYNCVESNSTDLQTVYNTIFDESNVAKNDATYVDFVAMKLTWTMELNVDFSGGSKSKYSGVLITRVNGELPGYKIEPKPDFEFFTIDKTVNSISNNYSIDFVPYMNSKPQASSENNSATRSDHMDWLAETEKMNNRLGGMWLDAGERGNSSMSAAPRAREVFLSGTKGLGIGMKKFGGTFRLNNSIGYSPKFYEVSKLTGRGWGGGGRGLIRTFSATTWGEGIAHGAMGVSLIIGGIDVYHGVKEDGYSYGQNARLAVGRTALGITGAMVGAEIGASIGVWVGGIGAVPGTIIGGVIGGVVGGCGGSKIGETIMEHY